jgi:hypothetical protein
MPTPHTHPLGQDRQCAVWPDRRPLLRCIRADELCNVYEASAGGSDDFCLVPQRAAGVGAPPPLP